MTVEAQTVAYSYTGDGVSKTFAFPARFLSADDILVGINGAVQVAGYSVYGAGESSGGYVQFGNAPLLGQRVTLLRKPPISQLAQFINAQTVLGDTLENALDKLTMICQYLAYTQSRTVRLAELDYGALDPIPSGLVRANRFLAFDSDGNPTLVTGDPVNITTDSILDATVFGRTFIKSTDREAAKLFAAALNFQSLSPDNPLPYGCKVGVIGDSNGMLMDSALPVQSYPFPNQCDRSHESPMRYFEAMHGGFNMRQRWEPADSSSGKYSVGDNGAWAAETSADFVRRLKSQIKANGWRAIFNFGCINDLVAVEGDYGSSGAFTIEQDNIIAEICRQEGIYLFNVGPPPRSPPGLSWPFTITPDPGWAADDPKRAGRAAIKANRQLLASSSNGLCFFMDVDPYVADANGYWLRTPRIMSMDNVHYWSPSAKAIGEAMYNAWGNLFAKNTGYPKDDNGTDNNLITFGALSGTAGLINSPYTTGVVADGWTLNNAQNGSIVAVGSKTTLDGVAAQRIDFTMGGAAAKETFYLSLIAGVAAPQVPARTPLQGRVKMAWGGAGMIEVTPQVQAFDGIVQRFTSKGWKNPYPDAPIFARTVESSALVPFMYIRTNEVDTGEFIDTFQFRIAITITNSGAPAGPHFVVLTAPKLWFLTTRPFGGAR